MSKDPSSDSSQLGATLQGIKIFYFIKKMRLEMVYVGPLIGLSETTQNCSKNRSFVVKLRLPNFLMLSDAGFEKTAVGNALAQIDMKVS